jgi:hypothetical protein
MENIPEKIINYCKILVDPKSQIGNLIRPFKHDLPDEYRPVILQNKYDIQIESGTTNLYIMPDNCITSNISADLGIDKLYYSIGIKEYKGKFEYIYMPQLEVEQAEKYRNIITNLYIPEKCKTVSTYVNVNHKPIIGNKKEINDIRNNDILKRIKMISKVYNTTVDETTIRYCSKTNSIDAIGLVDEQAVYIPDNVKDGFLQSYLNHINDQDDQFFKQFDDSEHTINALFTILKFCEEQNYKSMVKTNVLHLAITSDEPVTISVYQVYEIFKYLGNNEQGLEIMKETKWLKVLDIYIELLHILYFKKLEDIIKILYYPNGINLLAISYEDKQTLLQIKKSIYFNTIFSILIQVYQQSFLK